MAELAFIQAFLEDNLAYARDKFRSRTELTVTSKRDANDLLTEVDLTLQKRAIEAIEKRFPGDRIVSEEGDYAVLPKSPYGRCWVMDPIDGTNNFVRGLFPIFAVSLAFSVEGRAASVGVLLPGTGDLFLAKRGKGAFLNGKRLHVSTVNGLGEARVDFDFSLIAEREEMLTRAREVFLRAGQVRCYGSAVASICQIATGDTDGYLHMSLSPWDYAASQLIVEEAGGAASRLDGSTLQLFDGRKGVLITNGAVHQEVLGLLR
ncbi:MAG: inositol monophosphatase [Candidatus Hydrogenedentes bacterium]|nr:inositol monophosphatase [Candidatus Hydrogenedentota bacterium]